ncbi:MAG: hypothetical protein PHE61_07675, partial [Candidatus Omnitrophica bacterium]|nr:hypothetical protein [Candidatus Omnitrophota bacterium]
MKRLVAVILIFSMTYAYCPYFACAEEPALSDEGLLNLIEERAFRFFLDEANPVNGLVKDK